MNDSHSASAPAPASAASASAAQSTSAKAFAEIDRLFADYALDLHIPGLAWGVVHGGALVHSGTLGVQDFDTKRPVTMDTLFRIASMTKVFTATTILRLRDEGRLRLDDLAEDYVPEMRGWKYPTTDSPRIRIRDLLNHTAGFVTDDPWGDRQQVLSDDAFGALLARGIPFATSPGIRMEYSNLGYALLGRVITQVCGRNYGDEIAASLLAPLGMTSCDFHGDACPADRRAKGYRWQDDAWSPEPAMIHGAFGAMGGLHVTPNDYAKWVRFLLSAWPPRDDPDEGPVRRSTIRELAHGSNFPELTAPRPSVDGEERSKRATTYGMGMQVTVDAEFGTTLGHGGGYPGFGSFLMLLPDHDAGFFALSNRTYGAPRFAVHDAAAVMLKAGLLARRPVPVTDAIDAACRAAGIIYEKGDVHAAGDVLADNFLLDRDAEGWARDLAELRRKVGACDTTSTPDVKSALEAEFTWRGETGRVSGWVLLAPTDPPRIQALKLERK